MKNSLFVAVLLLFSFQSFGANLMIKNYNDDITTHKITNASLSWKGIGLLTNGGTFCRISQDTQGRGNLSDMELLNLANRDDKVTIFCIENKEGNAGYIEISVNN